MRQIKFGFLPFIILLVLVFSASLFANQSTTKPVAAKTTAKATAKTTHDVKNILDKLDDMWRGDSSKSVMTMKIKTKHWSRTLKMRAWSKGNEKSLIKVLKPMKERGTATLKIGDEIYNYLPKTDRTIKLTAAMMMGSWMGSHFTNDDLVKESRMSVDYTYSIDESFKKENSLKIICLPKPDAVVVWGKLEIIFRANDYQPISISYYDEDFEVTRVMTFGDYKKTSGRVVPMMLRITPADEPGEFTEVIYEELQFDTKISNSFFSLNQLRR